MVSVGALVVYDWCQERPHPRVKFDVDRIELLVAVEAAFSFIVASSYFSRAFLA